MQIFTHLFCPKQQAYNSILTALLLSVTVLLHPAISIRDAYAATHISLLQPTEIAVVVNTAQEDSKSLALYYMQKRFIPWKNLITIETVKGESCSRAEYEKEIAAPVRHALKELDAKKAGIRCLVLIRGIPLKIRQGQARPADRKRLERLKKEHRKIEDKKKGLEKTKKQKKKLKTIKARLKQLDREITTLSKKNNRASVDSELSLVLAGRYPLTDWLPNPLFAQFNDESKLIVKSRDLIMVSRLDGPDAATVRRIIDDSIHVEEHGGLHGVAYFDARWKVPENIKGLSGYALYDAAIHNAAKIVRKSGCLKVVLESTGKLFAPGTCNDAAIYCGWYSLAKYVDAFKWVKGAVGYHIASAECTTLRKKDSTVWCKKMLEKGVSVTLGPVYEPYVQAFPFPDLFFASLIYNGSTIAEAYWYSIPFTSWQMVLVADPLYRPFPITGMRLRQHVR